MYILLHLHGSSLLFGTSQGLGVRNLNPLAMLELAFLETYLELYTLPVISLATELRASLLDWLPLPALVAHNHNSFLSPHLGQNIMSSCSIGIR